jgi:hypothetical protein
MMYVSLVPQSEIDDIWPQIEEYMDGAAKYTYGRFTTDDIKDGLKTRPWQLWIAFKGLSVYGAVVTEIVSYPRMSALVMHFTGGEQLNEWKPYMLAMLQRFARENACTTIESYGRKGWAKVFKDDGFTSKFMAYELPVGVKND